MVKKFTGIDIAKFVFACLIPFLHIPFPDNLFFNVAEQYFARLGVPFFFAVSGMFLSMSFQKRGQKNALMHYEKNIIRLFVVWLIIYLPIIYLNNDDNLLKLAQKIIFCTPAYLWYLSSMIFAAIPFCLIKNRKVLYPVAACLYISGTLFSESYSWLTGEIQLYNEIFLTTRNGLFFALPMMCVGEIAFSLQQKIKIRNINVCLVISIIILVAEITVVQHFAADTADTSMYIFLPLVTLFVVAALLRFNPDFDTDFFRGSSIAIYLMQYGFIAVERKLFEMLSIPEIFSTCIIYITAVSGACLFYRLIRNTKIKKLLF